MSGVPFEEWKIGMPYILLGYKGICNQCFRDMEVEENITVFCTNIVDDMAYMVTTDPWLVCPHCEVRIFLIRIKHDIEVTKDFAELKHDTSS